jgi:hypothetical protein
MAEQKPAELTPEQKDLQMRVQLFDKEFQAIQNKYCLRAVAQTLFPGGAVLTIPIQVYPFNPPPTADVATDASK